MIAHEHVKSVVSEILRNHQCGAGVGVSVAEEDGLFDSCHSELGGILRRNPTAGQYRKVRRIPERLYDVRNSEAKTRLLRNLRVVMARIFSLRMALVNRDVIPIRILDDRHSADRRLEYFRHKRHGPLLHPMDKGI